MFMRLPYKSTNPLHEVVRVSSFLLLKPSQDTQTLDVSRVNQRYLHATQINIGQKIINICSPFGLNSSELFLNLTLKGIVSNQLTTLVYLCDL